LTFDLFEGRVGQEFEMDTGRPGPVRVELIEASQGSAVGWQGPDGQERVPFSLVFRGPTGPVVPQGTHRLRHGEVGELDLFLVPIGPDSEGMRYEAVFA
jgi:hypothetical protein